MERNKLVELFNRAIRSQLNGDMVCSNNKLKIIICIEPSVASVLGAYGVSLGLMRRADLAITYLFRSLIIDRALAESHSNLGTALYEARDHSRALAAYNNSILLNPSLHKSYHGISVILREQGDINKAVIAAHRSIKIDKFDNDSLVEYGNCLRALGRAAEAISFYMRGVIANPKHYNSYIGYAMCESDARRHERACHAYVIARSIDPSRPESYTNLGNLLDAKGSQEVAYKYLKSALCVDPKMPILYKNIGYFMFNSSRYEKAEKLFAAAYKLDPYTEEAASDLIHACTRICKWEGFTELREHMIKSIINESSVQNPFVALHITGDPEIQKKAAENYVVKKYFRSANEPKIKPETKARQYPLGKIKLGYFSSDFYNHATMHLLCECLELHNKSEFEVILFSFGEHTSDEFTARALAASNKFIDLSEAPDSMAFSIARNEDIDIAIDLKGHTRGSRFSLFEWRVAPVQISFLGYPGTTGSANLDYIIADRHVAPKNGYKYFSEKIISMPSSYQPNCRNRRISNADFLKSDYGLPSNGFIYCSFNSLHKLNPETYDRWLRILNRVNSSVLWLLVDEDNTRNRLLSYAQKVGIDPKRVIFCSTLPVEQHLKRICLGDLFLDSFPCSAHTTASDSLRMGVPILTMKGNSFASSVSSSLLSSVNVPELITSSEKEFEDMAVNLAKDLSLYNGICERLKKEELSKSIFDVKTYVSNIESAYKIAINKHILGIPAQHISEEEIVSHP